jgi:hypothetical protein
VSCLEFIRVAMWSLGLAIVGTVMCFESLLDVGLCGLDPVVVVGFSLGFS